MPHFTRIVLCLALVGITPILGCSGGKGDRPDIARVRGVVTLDGTPLADARVTFEPTHGRPSYGKTDAEGRFDLQYLAGVNGAMLGQHVVRISTHDMVPDPVTGVEKMMPERVPPTYNQKSVLTADVLKGDNDIVFELKSKK